MKQLKDPKYFYHTFCSEIKIRIKCYCGDIFEHIFATRSQADKFTNDNDYICPICDGYPLSIEYIPIYWNRSAKKEYLKELKSSKNYNVYEYKEAKHYPIKNKY